MKYQRFLLVSTGLRSKNNVPNIGLEIISQKIKSLGGLVEMCDGKRKDIDISRYDVIGFSVPYVLQLLDVLFFLENNKLLGVDIDKRPLLIGGGHGFNNDRFLSNALDFIIPAEGEKFIEDLMLENIQVGDKLEPWFNPVINSGVFFTKNHAIIEISRGCKKKCKFCSYTHRITQYREKSIELVKKQIDLCKRKNYGMILFLSANLGSYSQLKEIITYCFKKRIKIQNNDIRIDDYLKLKSETFQSNQLNLFNELVTHNYLNFLYTISVGLETPFEKCRYKIGKGISNKQLNEFIDVALENCRKIHFYLMYGLPDDDYQEWINFFSKIMPIAKKKRISIDVTIADFQPMPNTPLRNEKPCNIQEKLLFLPKFAKIICNTFYTTKETMERILIDPCRSLKGKFGHKQGSFELIMDMIKATENDIEKFLPYKSLQNAKKKYALKFNKPGTGTRDPSIKIHQAPARDPPGTGSRCQAT